MEQRQKQQAKSTIPGTPVVGVPVQRKRQPMAKTTVEASEQARRQKEAADRHNKVKDNKPGLEAGLNVSSMLTTKEHVGKVAQEPHKPDEMAALGQDQSARTGVKSVKTAPRKTEGKGTTDLVVTDPPTHASEGHTASPPSEADKVFAAAHPGKAPRQAKPKAKAAAKSKRK
jgi:hypothetical protein